MKQLNQSQTQEILKTLDLLVSGNKIFFAYEYVKRLPELYANYTPPNHFLTLTEWGTIKFLDIYQRKNVEKLPTQFSSTQYPNLELRSDEHAVDIIRKLNVTERELLNCSPFHTEMKKKIRLEIFNQAHSLLNYKELNEQKHLTFNNLINLLLRAHPIVVAQTQADKVIRAQIDEFICYEIVTQSHLESVCSSLRQDHTLLKYLSNNFRDNQEVIMAGVLNSWSALSYASYRLRSDYDFLLRCFIVRINFFVNNSANTCPVCESTSFVADTTSPYDIFGEKKGTTVFNSDIFGRTFKHCADCNLDMCKSYSDQSFLYKFSLKRVIMGLVSDIQKTHEVEQIAILKLQAKEKSEAKRVLRQKHINDNYTRVEKVVRSMPRYQTWRNEVLQKHGSICAKCSSNEKIEVDHYPKSMRRLVNEAGLLEEIYDEQSIRNVAYEFLPFWDVNNGAPLCKSCHDLTTSSKAYFKLNKHEN